MAAAVSGIFWLQFCSVGGSGDASFIFIYSHCAHPSRGGLVKNTSLLSRLMEDYKRGGGGGQVKGCEREE